MKRGEGGKGRKKAAVPKGTSMKLGFHGHFRSEPRHCLLGKLNFVPFPQMKLKDEKGPFLFCQDGCIQYIYFLTSTEAVFLKYPSFGLQIWQVENAMNALPNLQFSCHGVTLVSHCGYKCFLLTLFEIEGHLKREKVIEKLSE